MARREWIETTGAVGDVESPENYKGRKPYSVVFTYKVDDHFYSGTFTSYDPYRVGDPVAVKYDPEDPNRNDRNAGETLRKWLIAALFLLVALGLLLNVFHHS
jgi:hypothetical protein